MMDYRPTIGLEIHVELKTLSKMFCGCANNPDEARPNVNICPICAAHPGTLPAINREAVRQVLRFGAAVGGTFVRETEFERKSYFYPDIPKGYQISQYAHPLISGGELSLQTNPQAGIALTRVHLEEDTARSAHLLNGKSLVDFNRAGIPLMELVTEPVIHDAETAGRFARELQLLLRALGASDANLEKGEMRIETNISVAPESRLNSAELRSDLKPEFSRSDLGPELGTKVEIKNLNSFKAVERAIDFEIKRQTALLEKGEQIVQETRGWDEDKQETFHQRFKEGSADYRYFPEPDLPKLYLSEIPEFSPESIRASLPELPVERRARYGSSGIAPHTIEILLQNTFLNTLFEQTTASRGTAFAKLAANYLTSDIAGFLNSPADEGEIKNITAENFSSVMTMLERKELSSRGAKDVFVELYRSGGDARAVAEALNLIQIHDEEILKVAIDAVVARETKAVSEYKSGKEAALEYLVGQAMRNSGGAGNPEILRSLIQKAIRQMSEQEQ